MKDTLKQFIDSRLQEATRAQAIYPNNVYVASGLIKQLKSDKLHDLSESSSRDSDFKDIDISRCHHIKTPAKKDFLW
ncbi:hypothetical protein [Methanolobus vulcani]|nr:hypothetical protein [Methanolobus vulcani]